MEITNDIVLRPRFFENLEIPSEKALEVFEKKGTTCTDFKISRVDHHVFIRIPKKDQHFWSPQLHLEIYNVDNSPKLKGLFGPSPTVWTFFMFAHFVVATAFIGTGIWMYVNMSLGEEYLYAIVVMIFLFIIWFVLYFAGRLGKEAGKKEMHDLYEFMRNTLHEIK